MMITGKYSSERRDTSSITLRGSIGYSWLCAALMVANIARSHGTSLAQSVFLPSDRSLNPFSDPFIQRIISMDRKKLYAIPQMDDNDFLLQLNQDDDTMGGKYDGWMPSFA